MSCQTKKKKNCWRIGEVQEKHTRVRIDGENEKEVQKKKNTNSTASGSSSSRKDAKAVLLNLIWLLSLSLLEHVRWHTIEKKRT